MTAREAFVKAKKILESAGAEEPEAKAKVIVAHALDIEYSAVYSGIVANEAAFEAVTAMAQRCAAGEPAEYVTGKAYFRYLTLEVNPCVLIPRKETELVAGRAIELIKQNGYKTALDMCTGSGCIAISIASEAGIDTDAADISEGALATAKRNAVLNGVSGRVNFINSDMFDNIAGSYDIIVCNPPYVSEQEYVSLDDSVRLYEPKTALTAGNGFDFYRIIADEGLMHLNSAGALVLEIGADQALQVTELLKRGGFSDTECIKDYAGRDRIVCARRE